MYFINLPHRRTVAFDWMERAPVLEGFAQSAKSIKRISHVWRHNERRKSGMTHVLATYSLNDVIRWGPQKFRDDWELIDIWNPKDIWSHWKQWRQQTPTIFAWKQWFAFQHLCKNTTCAPHVHCEWYSLVEYRTIQGAQKSYLRRHTFAMWA